MLPPKDYHAMLCPIDLTHTDHYHTFADYNRHMIAAHKEGAVESVLCEAYGDIDKGLRMIARSVRANLIDYAPQDTALLTEIANKVGALVIDYALADDEH